MGIFNSAIFNNQVFNTGQTDVVPQGGGRRQQFELERHDWEVKELKRIKLEQEQTERELQAKETEITALEELRLQALADQALQSQLMALFIQAQALELERARLQDLYRRLMIEEDDMLVILMCLPFALF